MELLVERVRTALKTVREKGGSFQLRVEARPSSQEVIFKLFSGEGQFECVSLKQLVIRSTQATLNDEDVHHIFLELHHIVVDRQGYGSIYVEVDVNARGRAVERIVAKNEYRRASFVARYHPK
jgi:hypothetical protein